MFEDWGLWGLALSAFLSSTLLPGGSEALFLLLAAQEGANWPQLLMVASVANTLGGLMTYAMGFWGERGLVKYDFIKEPSPKVRSWVGRYGYFALLLSWLPIVGDGFCLAAGWLQMRWLPVSITIFLGKTLRYYAVLQVL